MKELIKNITEISAPSGRETAVREFIKKEIENYVDEIKIDKLGNLIAIKKGTSNKTVLFDAHMDEIGVVVTHILDGGFLKIEQVGGQNPLNLVGTRLNFNGRIGVVGIEGETEKELKENYKNLSLDNMYVDIGVDSKEDAEKIVPIGTFGTFWDGFVDYGRYCVSKAMDDRIGCAILIESIKNIHNIHNVIFAFTVQEEVGLVGSFVSSYDYDVDRAIAIDVTDSLDTPKALKRMSMSLGKGPCIKIKDNYSVSDREVVEWIKNTAVKNGIKYQLEVLTFGGTNAAGYQRTKSGIPSCTISIPTRYIHSPHEMVSYNDVENVVKLVTKLSQSEF
ncbi:M42 family metallopeptidase [Petrotoga sp. 9PWA.NaAc.5.4]|uniref:M42 family metallopeptidase n=1 Tax=Petrotoga sp. 9PWA.NaAc.5.4 TaxID=1434328 RepID=UPI000CCA9512|nr:M42 family metallopeptidase [Petrotoga sp. 9PWA.NaAc.5.4]PNR94799.1 aminopeptidase [Petrotoga sp. 9PWA.NaAc.5.4]